MTPTDVYVAVVERFDRLWYLIFYATGIVLAAIACQIGVKWHWFRKLERSNQTVIKDNRELMNLVTLHGQVTDSQKDRTERALTKVEQVAGAEHQKLEKIHQDVIEIRDEVQKLPSGTTVIDPSNPPRRRYDDVP